MIVDCGGGGGAEPGDAFYRPATGTFLHLRETGLGFSGLVDLKCKKCKINKKFIFKKMTTCGYLTYFPSKSCKNTYLYVYFIKNIIKRSVVWNLQQKFDKNYAKKCKRKIWP